MKKLSFLLFFCWQLLHADTANLQVVNAASFANDTSLAPGAIISILGSNLANTIASASNQPHQLGGVTVKVRGISLGLFYVGPTQINALIDATLAPGAATLEVDSPTGTFTKDIVLAASSNPGVFSLFGSGTRDGAIQNAVTYGLGPYTVTTNGKATFLIIYTTGLDLSKAPTVTIGGVPVQVTFYGASPCCPGLQQVNVQLPAALAGAGRVELAITSGTTTSNITEVVILPNPGQGAYPPAGENKIRNREISSIAYISQTHLALVADENDDVVRVINAISLGVTRTITLPEGAQPVAIAVNQPGALAVVAERNRGKVAIIDLATYMVTKELSVGSGPSDVAISGTYALVANQDSDTVSVIDMNKFTVTTVNVGRGPRGVAIDQTATTGYATNEDDGTISVINLTNFQVPPSIIQLPAGSRPGLIQLVPSLNIAVVTEPNAGPSGQILTIVLPVGSVSTALVNPGRNGGASGMAVEANNVYFANQSGASITVAQMGVGGSVHFTSTNVGVDLGARSIAVDLVDKLVMVASQGSGSVVVLDLFTNKIVGRINAVRSEVEGGPSVHNDHTDRQTAGNAPAIASMLQTAAARGQTITLTINGTNLQGADDVFFVDPATLPSNSNANGEVWADEHGHAPFGARDPNITASNILVNGAGTQLTATITISRNGSARQRVVRVEALNGDTSFVASSTNTFQIN